MNYDTEASEEFRAEEVEYFAKAFEMLSDRIRAYEYYNYFVINDDTVLVKVYDDDDEVMFTVKAKLVNEKLEVIGVW